MNNRLRNRLLLLLLGLPTSAIADPLIVVEDRGGSSALPYYAPLNVDAEASALKNLPPVPVKADETAMLPVTSRKITPGSVDARTINAGGLVQPLFLVGADKLSLSWLKQRRETLARIRAVGLAVEVPDAAALAAIRAAAPGLKIMPVSGDDLAARLGLAHYPVLITSTAIEQ